MGRLPVMGGNVESLIFSFVFFLALATVTQGHTEDYYIYQAHSGVLVITKKQLPPGSKSIQQLNLSEATDNQAPQSQQGNNKQSNGQTEASPKPSK